MTASTSMRREIEEIPEVIERLLCEGEEAMRATAREIAERDPAFLMSVARGSSDHACTYLKYVSELRLGLPMASVGPSVASVFGAELRAEGALCLSVSQSGKSPDIVQMTQSLRRSGAQTVAITNDGASPLAQAADTCLSIHAGDEMSVAATKTFVASLVTGAWLLAELQGDDAVIAAIRALPDQLAQATACDWSVMIDAISGQSLFTLGRGPSWAISNEASLKFKETCQIHAESYSSAEVLHGPVSMVDQRFPVLVFAAGDASEAGVCDVSEQMAAQGAAVFVTSPRVTRATTLPHVRTGHWITDPIAAIVSFYAMVDQLAASRNINPDAPRHLQKVTRTL